MKLIALPVVLLASLASAKTPFTIALEDAAAQFPGAPKVQAFSFAQWKGRWVMIGGRAAGYHSVGGGMAEFLRTDANRDVWVIDTTVQPARTYHAALDGLPPALTPVKDQWSSTAQLFYQDGEQLFIAGGYGQDHSGKWVTYPLVSRVHLPRLIEGVMAGRIPAESILFAKAPAAQSSGGQLTKLDDGFFYLVMGHSFNGSYTAFEGQQEQNTQTVSQVYLNEIRKLRIGVTKESALSVRLVEAFRDEGEFHRRDLNVTQILSPKGLGLAVYGGVFTPQTQLAFTKPVYQFANAAPAVDAGFEQKMNAYTCPTMLIYDTAGETMYTTFFGGISRYAWDEARGFVENAVAGNRNEATYLDGMQWSEQISTIGRQMIAGTSEETVHSTALPGFLGTNAVFIPAADVPRAHAETEILSAQALQGKRTLVGYVYGGIRASPYRFPYSRTAVPYNAGTVPTKPSEVILKVYVEYR